MAFKPKIYTEIITLRITEKQKQTLDKLRSYNVPVNRFIREAIKEKIQREHEDLKPKENYNPFLKQKL